ncbi:MAG: glucokinase, partial [Marinovum sp.]|nr:glucokinase [Marinovum sp.]
MPKNINKITLVADVGGTNTRIALARNGSIDSTSIKRYANREFD